MSVTPFDDLLENTLPKARTKDIIIQSVDKDTLVYDVKNDKAHSLNETLALIWKHCDGKTDRKTLVSNLSKELNTKIEEDFVMLGLMELDKANLLKTNVRTNEKLSKVSRRKVLMKYALPTMMLPVAISLVTPKSVHAQASCLTLNQSDCLVTPCCPGLDCITTMLAAASGICMPMPSP